MARTNSHRLAVLHIDRNADLPLMYVYLSEEKTFRTRPNVNIQVPRSEAPLHVGLAGNFTILGSGPHTDLDVVHTEALTSALYMEDPDEIATHRDAWQRITSAAESVKASTEMITEISNQA